MRAAAITGGARSPARLTFFGGGNGSCAVTLQRLLANSVRQLKRSSSRPRRYESNNLVTLYGWTLGYQTGLTRASGVSDQCQCRHAAEVILDVEAEVWALFSPCECWRSSRLRILTKQEIADLPLCLMMRTLLSGGGQGRPE